MMEKINNFAEIQNIITEIYHNLKDDREGEVADYIPQLAKVNPDLFAISVCGVNGERFDIGDNEIDFCLQSCSKPLTYCIARDLYANRVHEHVGYEPSGRSFNAFVLDKNGHPHNPMINAGAIMTCSLIESDLEPADRFDLIRSHIKRMSGKQYKIGFNNSVFLSEKQHADRNYALAYFMNEKAAFPPKTNLMETLDLYFQACSVTINCSAGSIIAATLAAGGVCPITQEKIYTSETIRDCLSLMYQCGMYDYSGQFAFEIGLPAKSGVSGCLFLVIPNQMGICIWSPRLDEMGNSVRGVKFCHELINKFNFHIFHNIVNQVHDEKQAGCQEMLQHMLISAASKNDLDQIASLAKKVSINVSDYDGRTSLHLAAAEGHLDAVNLLLELGAEPRPLDRWGNTPYHEAKKKLEELKVEDENCAKFQKIAEILRTFEEQISNNGNNAETDNS